MGLGGEIGGYGDRARRLHDHIQAEIGKNQRGRGGASLRALGESSDEGVHGGAGLVLIRSGRHGRRASFGQCHIGSVEIFGGRAELSDFLGCPAEGRARFHALAGELFEERRRVQISSRNLETCHRPVFIVGGIAVFL